MRESPPRADSRRTRRTSTSPTLTVESPGHDDGAHAARANGVDEGIDIDVGAASKVFRPIAPDDDDETGSPSKSAARVSSKRQSYYKYLALVLLVTQTTAVSDASSRCRCTCTRARHAAMSCQQCYGAPRGAV